jgi:phosphoribosylformimino-5-aminoimidazole carboxamide ribonucleotide (ProFAR) isomerase
MGEPAQVTVGIITIFFGSIVVFILSQKIGGWREHKRMQLYENLHTKNVSIPTTIHKEPGIIAVWYKNFKEKTCVNITIEKETSDHE